MKPHPPQRPVRLAISLSMRTRKRVKPSSSSSPSLRSASRVKWPFRCGGFSGLKVLYPRARRRNLDDDVPTAHVRVVFGKAVVHVQRASNHVAAGLGKFPYRAQPWAVDHGEADLHRLKPL